MFEGGFCASKINLPHFLCSYEGFFFDNKNEIGLCELDSDAKEKLQIN